MVSIEDEVPKLDPPLPIDQEPFLKELEALVGKGLEGVPMFHGKMDTELVFEWIRGMEIHFECDGVTEA